MSDTEMTRFLAEKCMDYRVCESSFHPAWNPLSSISDAFQVMEKMGGMWIGPASNGHGWIAAKLSLADYGDEDSPATKYAETAARAICLAAIAALEGK